MKELSKEDIALMQLVSAIDLFNQRKFIPALTLGAAAEELYSGLLKKYSSENNINIQNSADITEGIFDLTYNIIGLENYKSQRNKYRNELKHHGEARNADYISADFENLARFHILDAIINNKLRTNHLPNNEVVKSYCEDNGIC